MLLDIQFDSACEEILTLFSRAGYTGWVSGSGVCEDLVESCGDEGDDLLSEAAFMEAMYILQCIRSAF